MGYVSCGFLASDAQPKSDLPAWELCLVVCEPPERSGLRQGPGEGPRIMESNERALKSAEAQATDDVVRSFNVPLTLPSPRQQIFRDKPCISAVADEIAVPCLTIEVRDKEASQRRDSFRCENLLKEGETFHVSEVVFCIQKNTEAMRSIYTRRQNPQVTGVLSARTRDGVLFERQAQKPSAI